MFAGVLARIKVPLISFVVTAFILAIMVLLMITATFPDIVIERVSFTNTYSGKDETIEGLLLTPEQIPGTSLPAVVFSHGLLCNKEIYLSLYREFARRGFAVLAIDLPGHGGSGGHCDLGGSEYTALLSAYDLLVDARTEIDPDRIAVAGHSLGGVSATKAGVLQPEEKFSAVVAIWCWQSLPSTLETVFGPYEEFVGKVWPLFIWSRSCDLGDAAVREERDIISRVGPGVPPNYLVIVGSLDEGISVDQERELVAAAAGQEEVEAGRIYGSFEDGTARGLVLTSDDHVTEVFSGDVFDAMYTWICRSFGMRPQGSSPIPLLRQSLWAWILFLAYVLSFIFAVIAYRLLEERMRSPVPPFRHESPASRGSAKRMGLYSSLFYLLASLFTLPLSILMGATVLVPFFVGDIVSSLALIRGLLVLAGAGAFLFAYYGWRPGQPPSLPWREKAVALAWSAVPPLGGFALLLLIYAPLAHTLHLGPGLPYSWPWFMVYVMLLAFMFWIEGRYFHLLLLPLFGVPAGRKRTLGYLASEAGMRGLGATLLFLPFLIADPLHPIGRAGSVRMPVLVLSFLVLFPPCFILAWINLHFRKKGTSLLLPSLGVALAQAFLITAVICVR